MVADGRTSASGTLPSGIYQIVNLVNGKSYVGSAVNLQARWKQHKKRIVERLHSRKLQNAFDKYGLASFEFLILEDCTIHELEPREQYWIDFLNTVRSGYNTRPLANSNAGIRHKTSPMLGRKHSKETLLKLSESHKGQPGYWLGKKRSPETIKKITETKKKSGLPGPMLGKKHSEESKRKMSETKRISREVREASRGQEK